MPFPTPEKGFLNSCKIVCVAHLSARYISDIEPRYGIDERQCLEFDNEKRATKALKSWLRPGLM